MQCIISSGDMPVSFAWLLNGKRLSEFKDISITSMGKKISALTVDSISREHAGNYTCVTKNNAGTSSFTAALNVKGIAIVFPVVSYNCRTSLGLALIKLSFSSSTCTNIK